jgi:recombination protein RecA
MRFLGMVQPERLMEKSHLLWEDRSTKSHGQEVTILSIKPVGVREVVTIGTSTKTLIADGLMSHNSQGKTTLILKAIAANQAIDPDWTVFWVAAEDFIGSWAETCGCDLSRIIVLETNVMEYAFTKVLEFLDTKVIDCVVIDSLPALVPEKLMEEFTMGLGARLIGKFFRKQQMSVKRSMINEERPVLCFMVNQFRDKIGVMYGDPRTTPGGKAKNFFYFTRVEVARDEWISIGKTIVGQVIKAKTVKNKTFPSQKVATVDFYFEDGNGIPAGSFDRLKEIMTLGIAYEIIVRRGAYYDYGGQSWQGTARLLDGLREDEALQASIIDDVMSYVLKGPGVHVDAADTAPKRVDRAAKKVTRRIVKK